MMNVNVLSHQKWENSDDIFLNLEREGVLQRLPEIHYQRTSCNFLGGVYCKIGHLSLVPSQLAYPCIEEGKWQKCSSLNMIIIPYLEDSTNQIPYYYWLYIPPELLAPTRIQLKGMRNAYSSIIILWETDKIHQ